MAGGRRPSRSRAVDEQRGLVLTRARHDRGAAESGKAINLANIVFVRVSTKRATATWPHNCLNAHVFWTQAMKSAYRSFTVHRTRRAATASQ